MHVCLAFRYQHTWAVDCVTDLWVSQICWISIMDVLNICRFASGVVVSLQAVPLMMMGDMTDVGRRSGTLFTVLSIGALVGPPISGAIAAATGDF
jgi:MCP family monocarboxylic acid transporter-like MFS transporter 10